MPKSISSQKRLAAKIKKCGINRIWCDPTESSEIKVANSRFNVRKLMKEGLIIRKPVAIHSRDRVRKNLIAKRKGRHTGTGKRKGTKEARMPVKVMWIRRTRVLRRLLKKYREAKKIDKHQYHSFYLRSKGNVYKNKRVLIEHIHEKKAADNKKRQLVEQSEAKKQRARLQKERKAAAKELKEGKAEAK
jgi:large subunit ribosomal protein L19e